MKACQRKLRWDDDADELGVESEMEERKKKYEIDSNEGYNIKDSKLGDSVVQDEGGG